MKGRTVFQELSRFMPDREREKLLAKLNKNLFVPEAFEQKNYHREIDRNQRDEFITRDLNSLSWRFFTEVCGSIEGPAYF